MTTRLTRWTAFRETDGVDSVSRMGRIDLLTQLPDDLLLLTDKMTMATSLECRVPWFDDTVVSLSLSMPARYKIRGRTLKHTLKRALRSVLPAEVLDRPKRGFGAPMGAWLREELAPLTRQLLSRESVEKRGLLRWEVVRETMALHDASRADPTDHLLTLIALELWARLHLDGRSVEDASAELSGDAAR